MSELADLAARYGTDKGANYLSGYDALFGHLRDGDIRLLELGVKEGASLFVWRDYFPRGLIVGLDINAVSLRDPSGRIRVYQGAQQDTDLLDKIARETAPAGFDIIIDDCSHIGVQARASFWRLFDRHLKNGGVYSVEDWGTGYWDDWPDGVRYRNRRARYNAALDRFTSTLSRLRNHPTFANLPFARSVVSKLKAAVVKRQYHSHDFGMVAFVKELVDEVGMGDITKPNLGIAPHRPSKFREMRMSHGQVLVIKA